MDCPACKSENTVKNGSIHNGKSKHMCKDCGRQFVDNPNKKYIPQHIWNMVDKMLLEKISLAGISRVTGISKSRLQKYVNKKLGSIPYKIEIYRNKGKLTIQCDELWSFVGDKANTVWVWLAIDQESREIVGVYFGNRDREGAQGLWQSLPPVYRQCAVCYTDFWASYESIIPTSRHKPVGKESGKTSYIERFNLTLRQRVSRLVRKTLSFSKKIVNHIGAILYFIHHYNSEKSANAA